MPGHRRAEPEPGDVAGAVELETAPRRRRDHARHEQDMVAATAAIDRARAARLEVGELRVRLAPLLLRPVLRA